MSADETELSIFEFADSFDDVLFSLDEEWRFVFLSRRAVAISGQAIENLLGRTLWDVFPTLVGTPIEAAYRKAMTERLVVHFEHPSVISDNWYDIHVYPYRQGIAVYCRNITKRKLAERALCASEERLRTQYENLPIPTYTWQRVGDSFKLINFNAAADAITNGAVRQIMGQTLDVLYGDDPVIREAIWKCWEKRQTIRREMQYKFRRVAKTCDLAVTFAFAPPDMVIVHTEDVTAQKDAERKLMALNETLELRVAERTVELQRSSERNQWLVREVEHRVGNNFAALIGLVGVMRNQAHNADSFASAIDARLKAMAHVHKILTAGEWCGATLRGLVTSTLQALQSLAPHPVQEQVEGPDVPLDPRKAYALALILTEWFTNSCKYGAHSVPDGRLQISWAVAEMAGASGVRLSWVSAGALRHRRKYDHHWA